MLVQEGQAAASDVPTVMLLQLAVPESSDEDVGALAAPPRPAVFFLVADCPIGPTWTLRTVPLLILTTVTAIPYALRLIANEVWRP